MILAGNRTGRQAHFSSRINIPVYNAILEHSMAKGASLAFLLVLAKYADGNGVCWPGLAVIAKHLHCSERQARTIKQKLVQSRELKITGSNARWKTDVFEIVCVRKLKTSPLSRKEHVAVAEEPNACMGKRTSPKEEKILSQEKRVPVPLLEESKEQVFKDPLRPEQDTAPNANSKNSSGGTYGKREREPQQFKTWAEQRNDRLRRAKAETYRRLGIPFGEDV